MNNTFSNSNLISIIDSDNRVLQGDLLAKFKKINAAHKNTKHTLALSSKYAAAMEELFNIENPLTSGKIENYSRYLGGFIEGEGSVNVSAKKWKGGVGLHVDPEFSITQNINGISNLCLALRLFQTGRLGFKSGSNATFCFVIDNRKSLEEKVVPFYEKYVFPYGAQPKIQRVQRFKKLLQLFNEKKHLEASTMISEILPLWDAMRVQRGQKNESFKNLQEAQQHVMDFMTKKEQNNSEAK